MPTIGNLNTSLTLESSSFLVGLKRAAQQTQVSVGSIERSFNTMKNAAQIAFTALATGAFIDAAGRALDYASSLGEVSQQLGVTARDLQIYRFAATQVGVSQEDMDRGLQKLTRTLGEARAGAKGPVGAFRELSNLIGRDIVSSSATAGDAIPQIAEALGKITDPAKRARIEVELFGKTGQKLDTLLASGRGSIDQMRNAAERLGLVLSDKLIGQADEAADKLAAVKQLLEARLTGVVAENADKIITLADAFFQLTQNAVDALQATSNFFNLRKFNSTDPAERAAGEQGLLRTQSGRTALRNEIQDRLTANATRRAAGQTVTSYLPFGLADVATPSTAAERAASDLEFQNLNRIRNALGRIDQAATRSRVRPPTLRSDGSGSGSSGRNARGRSPADASDPFAGLQQSIRNAVADIGVTPVELGNIQFTLDKDSSSALRKLFDESGVDLTTTGSSIGEAQKQADEYLQRWRDINQQVEEDRARRMEDTTRSLAGIYQDLFTGGTKAVWRDFKQIGLGVIAELLAKFTIAKIGGKGFDLGGTLTSALGHFGFGGFFANGGEPPLGKASIVGERGPELFIPKVPGRIIPNGAGGGSVVNHFDLRGALVTERVYDDMQRIAANTVAAAAPTIAQAAQIQTIDALHRPRL